MLDQPNQSNTSQEPRPNFQSQPPKKFGLPAWVSILIAAVAIIIVSLASWVAYRAFISRPTELPKESPEEKQISPLPVAEEIAPIDETANWQIYRNEELGFEFKYPKEYGDIEFSINTGETGEIFRGHFLNSNSQLSFGGITRDFSAGREGSPLDTQGYIKDNNKYFFKFVNDKKWEINPSKFISLDEGKDKALIIGNQVIDFLTESSEGPLDRWALINLKNNKFPGIGFFYNNIPESEISIFDSIISTFKFTK